MKLQTPVIDLPCRVGISYGDKILLIGSCFADNIGQALADYGFDVCVNPFGTLYNPASIASAIERLGSGRPFTKEECVQMGSGSSLICSFSHHTSFARTSEDEFLENANVRLAEASEFYRSCSKVIVTLGTAWCYRHDGAIVSNCLKRPAAEFCREMLSIEECTALLRETVSDKSKEYILTVSPIRHLADGAHGNQLSKSTLLMAIDGLISRTGNEAGRPVIDYFPSYEIMMDELRDYRFYAEDMTHPSPQATAYILERFLAWALPASERQTLEDNIRRFRQSQHRNFHI